MNIRPRTALVLFALTTSSLAGACGSTASDTAAAPTTSTAAPTSTTAAPASSTSTTAAPTSTTDTAPTIDVSFAERSGALLSFGTAWDGADWATMETLASPEVVDIAKEWHADGSDAATSLRLNIENECATEAIGSCQIVYGGPQGPGLIFDVAFELTDSGTMVTDLVFGGDAG